MSDHDDTAPDVTPDADFDDPAYDELRALLGDARATDPVPPEIATRLDDTLAALQEERRAEADVVPLRRRAAGRLLVAAAAVVVIGAGGAGIAQLAQHGDSGDKTAAADSSATDSGGASTLAPAAPETVSGNAPAPSPTTTGLIPLDGAAVPQFTTARFAEQAAAYGRQIDSFQADGLTNSDGSRSPSTDSPDLLRSQAAKEARACSGPSIPDSQSVPILLDDEPAVLVVHPATDGTQEIDAWSCDGTKMLTTTTVTR